MAQVKLVFKYQVDGVLAAVPDMFWGYISMDFMNALMNAAGVSPGILVAPPIRDMVDVVFPEDTVLDTPVIQVVGIFNNPLATDVLSAFSILDSAGAITGVDTPQSTLDYFIDSGSLSYVGLSVSTVSSDITP